jgi:chorismate synthase
MLRFLTAGESHGPALVAILEGMPAGLAIDRAMLATWMRRRQGGYGRGRRMVIESDQVEFLSGLRRGVTLGSPIAIEIRNRDWSNWQETMALFEAPADGTGGARRSPVTRPRPGHADLAGSVKYGHRDLRNVLERASARETAARVALGAICAQLLQHLDVTCVSHVIAIGNVRLPAALPVAFEQAARLSEDSMLRCVDPETERRMVEAIDRAKAAGDTLGGAFEVIVRGLPPGVGSHVQWDRRLDGRLGQALLSIPAIKAVSIGDGVGAAARPGSEVHDPMFPAEPSDDRLPSGITRRTNHAGGLEGGMTNGEELRLTAYMKPIATLMTPLPSVDLATGGEAVAAIERSDTCAVTAAAVVGEAVTMLVLAEAVLETFGGDTLEDLTRTYHAWQANRREWGGR